LSLTHKRLMLLAMVSMLPPSISRWPIAVKQPAPVIMGDVLLFLAAAPISDLLASFGEDATLVGWLRRARYQIAD
jgi:hypothetical protein